jgi:hypothetical protein
MSENFPDNANAASFVSAAEQNSERKRKARIRFVALSFALYALTMGAISVAQNAKVSEAIRWALTSQAEIDRREAERIRAKWGCMGSITHDAQLEDYGPDGRVIAERARENLMTHQ